MESHGFVGYLTAGYPNREESLRMMAESCEAGLDVLEAGFPAENPSHDGVVIRLAQAKADHAVAQDLDYWRELRRRVGKPIWLMGYKADLERGAMGLRIAEAGLCDALVIPDLSEAEQRAWRVELRGTETTLVGFINGDQPKELVDQILRDSRIIYHQLYTGPTGIAHNDDSYLPLMRYAREHGQTRLFAGFGIDNAHRVEELMRHGYDGAIIGSAIMKMITEGRTQAALRFIREIQEAIRRLTLPTAASAGAAAGHHPAKS